MTTTISVLHDFCAGHRVAGHESKCAHLHGHNYRVTFEVAPHDGQTLDGLGRVLDFAEVKARLVAWLEAEWDHRFIAWEEDPLGPVLRLHDSAVVLVPFNPTAENMARYLLMVVGPKVLADTGTVLVAVHLQETRKCSATCCL